MALSFNPPPLRWPTRPALIFTAALLALGAVGGEVARLVSMPLPWMLGSLITTALVVAFLPKRIPAGYRFSQPFRMVFIAIIGAMIGAQLTAEVFQQWPRYILSLAGVTLFVALAHGWNYWMFRRIGGYDRPTAFFCGTPGGLMESIAMGEAAGADIRVLTIQQFLRIILVVSLVPLGLSIFHGHPVGSAAGIGFSQGAGEMAAIPVLLLVAALGLVLGVKLKLPAGQLIGPLIVAGAATLSGLVVLDPPNWVISVAQVVIGVSLGVRFIGITGRMLGRALGLSLASVAGMLVLGALLAGALNLWTGQPFEVLLLSFAPGGVTEMGLVALSLAANPAVVAFHHLYRIVLTVVQMSVLSRWIGAR
ncbi:AbrB family transcriptional regulator [Oceaniglobus roseus]|uniref:AbrB family transcriptional regulator n=1 Tax=Oceaniglobus roseus TaxID=1737570 RepID=UPI000C7F2D51|nr:AbrB family transcriptional regulator [Kandeliimicrobium roseum]